MRTKMSTLPNNIILWFLPFPGYSYYATNVQETNAVSQIKQRNILLSDFNHRNKDGFCELIVDKKTNSIIAKSFKKDYHKRNANVYAGGLSVHVINHIHSYLVRNNKYIISFYSDYWYNVYDMINDQWLIEPPANEKTLKKSDNNFMQSVLINDKIIITSKARELHFYCIANEYIENPLLIHTYNFKTQDVKYICHGMEIIDFVKLKSDEKLKKSEKYKFKLILFAGMKNYDILSSFLILDIVLSYISNKFKFKLIKVCIDENLVDKKCIKLKNIKELKTTHILRFGYQKILNDKNETVLIMIGGDGTGTSIHLFNCNTKEFTCKDNVEFMNVFAICLILLYAICLLYQPKHTKFNRKQNKKI